jgi:hypothetical protein
MNTQPSRVTIDDRTPGRAALVLAAHALGGGGWPEDDGDRPCGQLCGGILKFSGRSLSWTVPF